MCSRDGDGSATLSRVSILVGFICALSYFGAFVGTGWVYTKEPYRLTNLNLYTSVTFKIGLWRTCHSFKRINSTITIPMHGCSSISYTNWSQIAVQQISTRSSIESTIGVVSRIRWCAIFVGCGFSLLLIGFICSVVGHFYRDNKTLLASAIYTLSGLSLAAGLFVFVCILTDSFAIHANGGAWWTEEEDSDSNRRSHEYRYGWCFLLASMCCIFVEMVAVLCITVHHKRCRMIAQMIKNIAPIEEKTVDTDYIPGSNHVDYEASSKIDKTRALDSETPPDICSTFLRDLEHTTTTVSGRDANTLRCAHPETCSQRIARKTSGNFATLNTRNYRYLNHTSSLARRYSTVSGCGSVDGVPSSSCARVLNTSMKCRRDIPKIKSIADVNSAIDYDTAERLSKKSEIPGDSFGL